jgi:hypothetical protein
LLRALNLLCLWVLRCRAKKAKGPANEAGDAVLPEGEEDDAGSLGSDEYEEDSFIVPDDDSDMEEDATTSGAKLPGLSDFFLPLQPLIVGLGFGCFRPCPFCSIGATLGFRGLMFCFVVFYGLRLYPPIWESDIWPVG